MKKHGEIDARYFNDNTASVIIQEFNEWKNTHLQGRFHYANSNTPIGATALSYADGSPREEIAQGRIGTKIAPGDPSNKYLYEVRAYDSPLEKQNLLADIEEVVLFGTNTRSILSIPTIIGGMYSPDFMYVVRRTGGEKELNIVVETKDVENKNSLRGNEKASMDCAKLFFEILSEDGYTVHFRDQLNNRQMAQIIKEVLAE